MASHSGAGDLDYAEEGPVANFCSVTACTPQQARFYLEASNGQFDRAVAMFYEQGGREQDEEGDFGEDEEAAAPEAEPSYRRHQPAAYNWRQHRNLLGILFRVPRAVVQTGAGILLHTVRFTASLVGLLGVRILPPSLLRSLEGSMRRLTQEGPDPQTAASSFVRGFAQKYGDRRPRWLECGWAEGCRRAHGQFKFLFVYLHSPSHQDTDVFCHDTLCNAEVVEFVNANFLCWAGSITTADAFQLSQGLKVQAYPYVALLAFSGARTRLIAAAEGHFTAEALLPVLRDAQEQQAIHLLAEQVEHNERDFNRRLREEQDAEYQKSLQADMERERQRHEASQAEASVKRAAQEQAAKEQAAKDAERRRLADRDAALLNRRERASASLGPEPAASAPGIVQIRVRLPNGSNFQRKFLADDPLQRAYDFVDSLDNLDILKYSLASSYPRRVFAGGALQQSFQDLGLAPQAMLFVQSEDD